MEETKLVRYILMAFGLTWIVFTTVWTLYFFISGWTAPNMQIGFSFNAKNEFWYECSLIIFAFIMFLGWAVYRVKWMPK